MSCWEVRIEAVGSTKTGRVRVVDIDDRVAAALRAHRLARAELSLVLTRADQLMFGMPDGGVRHPERFGREWRRRLARAREKLGDEAPTAIRLHDLRHTHATLLLKAGVPVKVISERLGHASPVITMTIYAHVIPGMQREAARRFGALVYGSLPEQDREGVRITGVSNDLGRS